MGGAALGIGSGLGHGVTIGQGSVTATIALKSAIEATSQLKVTIVRPDQPQWLRCSREGSAALEAVTSSGSAFAVGGASAPLPGDLGAQCWAERAGEGASWTCS